MEPLLPEEIIHRLEDGDPDPELQKLADRAAWQAFHDPWEPPPASPEPEMHTGAIMEPEAAPPFTLETIDSYLEAEEYSCWKSNWNSRMVFYSYGPKADRVVRATFSIQGKADDVFVLRMVADRRVDPAQFELAWRLCSEFASEYRYPRAFLEIPPKPENWEDDPEAGAWDPSGLLVLDYHLPLKGGITQPTFNAVCDDVIGASWGFWRMARERYGL